PARRSGSARRDDREPPRGRADGAGVHRARARALRTRLCLPLRPPPDPTDMRVHEAEADFTDMALEPPFVITRRPLTHVTMARAPFALGAADNATHEPRSRAAVRGPQCVCD